MRFIRTAFRLLVSLLSVQTGVLAHHALQTQFYMNRTITVTGEVKKIDWSNPHVRLYLEVKGESKTTTWELYMASPNQEMMNGWKIDTYRPGDHLSVDVYPARDGSSVGFAKTLFVALADSLQATFYSRFLLSEKVSVSKKTDTEILGYAVTPANHDTLYRATLTQ